MPPPNQYNQYHALSSTLEKAVSPQHQHHYHGHQHTQLNLLTIEPPKEILSVSGKKKCSYCNDELGKIHSACTSFILYEWKKTIWPSSQNPLLTVYLCSFSSIRSFSRKRSCNDNRKSAPFLPFGLFQMLRLPCAAG